MFYYLYLLGNCISNVGYTWVVGLILNWWVVIKHEPSKYLGLKGRVRFYVITTFHTPHFNIAALFLRSIALIALKIHSISIIVPHWCHISTKLTTPMFLGKLKMSHENHWILLFIVHFYHRNYAKKNMQALSYMQVICVGKPSLNLLSNLFKT